MNDTPSGEPHRILVIDDNPAIHDDIRKILGEREAGNAELNSGKALLFGDVEPELQRDQFEIDSAFQGEEGLRKVQEAGDSGRPYALAFVDVRMPPGWDGVETITRIWRQYPELQVVICTAYSDYSWEDMVGQIGRSANMVVLKKPFDNIEVVQLAHALTEKWNLSRRVAEQMRNLDQLVDRRTTELQETNAQLKREIAERLQVERALVLSEERFAKAFRANPIPLAIQSLQRETLADVNPGFQDLTGYSRADLTSRTAQELGLWVEAGQGRVILDALRISSHVRHLPCQLRNRAGAVRDLLLSVELIDLDGDTSLLLIAQDVTEHLLLEKQLRHSQKMEAVGQLAAGIAHDFNNMLTVIQGNASLVISDQAPDSPDLPLLERIVAASQRSAKLVRQLLTFSHKQVMEVSRVNVTELLASMGEMLPRMLGEQVTVRFGVAPDLPLLSADAGMIEQLLVNLAVNARDAMPRGGQLTIAAEAVELTEATSRSNHEAREGRFLCLSVRDNGSGIPPEVLPRIFEPFFTTKPVGLGTGLGLATVYGIVRQHAGWIEVHSEVGLGTTFRAYFPFGPELAAAALESGPGAATGLRGTETILVVEDEEIVRHCVTTILKAHGYNVVTASTGAEALRLWAGRLQEVDLLLTDMVMPDGVTGLELARRMLAGKPDLKTIFTSGYSREMTASRSPFLVGQRFLAKPYQSSVLLRTVRECLDRSRPFAVAR